MKQSLWWLAALVAITLAGVLVIVHQPGGSGPSVLSPGASGWQAARQYLERRGATITLLDRALERHQAAATAAEPDLPPLAPGDVLVTAFPWSGGTFLADPEPYLEHAAAGGTLIVAYSGAVGGLTERQFLTGLDLEPLRALRKAPLGYGGWRQWQRELWELTPGDGLVSDTSRASAAAPRLRPPQSVPEAPDGATVFLHAPAGVTAGAADGPAAEKGSTQRAVDEAMEIEGYRVADVLADGGPVVFALRHGAGRVLLLPADLFSNARLVEPGNADLLESVLAWAGPRWNFDEGHHGLRAPGETTSPIPRRVLDLFLLHLFALYLLAIWHLARRFGPAWREPAAHSGSAGSLLLGVGALHRKLGHHRAAGELLLGRIRQLDRVQEASAFDRALRELTPAADDAGLVRLAGEAAQARREYGAGKPRFD